MAEGGISLHSRRNKHRNIPIVSTFDTADTDRKYPEVIIENWSDYWQYQVIFPRTNNNGIRDLKVAKVELPRYLLV